LKRYLSTLVLQGDGENRVGFPKEILIEIGSIQAANEKLIEKAQPRTSWDNNFINR